MKKQQRKSDERVGFPDISDSQAVLSPKKDGLTVRNIGKTNSLVVLILLFFHYSLF